MTHHVSTDKTSPGRSRLRGLLTLTALTAMTLACGGDDDGDDRNDEEPGGAPTDQPATEPGDPGAFPEEPQLVYDLSERPDGWPDEVTEGESSATFDDRGLALEAQGDPLWVPTPEEVEPGHRGVLLEAEVSLDAGPGAAGIFCRGSLDAGTGYALTVGSGRSWALWRFDRASRTIMQSGTLTEAELPDEAGPVRLTLVCGAGAENQLVSLAFLTNTRSFTVIQDAFGLPAEGPTRVGFVAVPDGDAAVAAHAATLAVSLAEAQAEG